MSSFITRIAAVSALFFVAATAWAAAPAAPVAQDEAYRLQPGDVLQVNVWKETDLQLEVLVRPDGAITFPLVGELPAAARTFEAVRADLEQRLGKYIPDVLVTLSAKLLSGNRIYVIGKVNRPGDFAINRPTDVTQALALAGGTTPFADVDGIRILRRVGAQQRSLSFKYSDIEHGRNLEQNVVLLAGDTVVVP